ncbi:MAG TPA: hypothetical protein PLE92_01635 [Lentisphaeria bacterium]|nr:hypothetical protein [Lentisphaerota bacterium]OQC13526.1 MAG: hypothetical protein BWX73_02332 [Lentisphaerae bacterium ADurb.Bin082]HPY90200.1 hypothetical protein [Lentisphaeria bacterium]HQC51805.1 hypothetical protein [Lentisphaeria bacterium]HQL88067.1 hypothetical protein [Lentisphaeria bacterium]
MNTDAKREYGLQPLDGLMTELELVNHDLVAASTEQLTHKMVSKGRKGRWLTMPVRMKVLRALNQASGKTFALSDLFNYD